MQFASMVALAAALAVLPSVASAQYVSSTQENRTTPGQQARELQIRSDADVRHMARCVVGRNKNRAITLLDAPRGSSLENNIRDALDTFQTWCFPGINNAASFSAVLQRGAYAETVIADMPAEERVQAMAHGPADAKWQSEFGAGADPEQIPGQAVARCVVAAGPSDALALIATEPFSPAEAAAFGPIVPRLGGCITAGTTGTFSRQSLRALIADAMYQYLRASRAAAPAMGAPR